MTARLSFLGSGDSQGVPRWWCECAVCSEARATGLNARTRPSVVLHTDRQNILIDAAPEFRLQASKAGLRHLDAVLITHAHNDHVLGMGDVLDHLRHTSAETHIYAPAAVLPQLEARFPYAFTGRFAHRFQVVPETICGWRVRAFQVPHGFNGTAFAYRLERHGKALVYCSDAIGIPEQLLKSEFSQLELLILGATFWDESHAQYTSRSVYDVREALGVIAQMQPKRAVLTHLGHGVDVHREAELPPSARFARDGLHLELW